MARQWSDAMEAIRRYNRMIEASASGFGDRLAIAERNRLSGKGGMLARLTAEICEHLPANRQTWRSSVAVLCDALDPATGLLGEPLPQVLADVRGLFPVGQVSLDSLRACRTWLMWQGPVAGLAASNGHEFRAVILEMLRQGKTDRLPMQYLHRFMASIHKHPKPHEMLCMISRLALTLATSPPRRQWLSATTIQRLLPGGFSRDDASSMASLLNLLPQAPFME